MSSKPAVLPQTGTLMSNHGAPRTGAVLLLVGGVLAAAALSLHLRGGAPDVDFVRRIEAAPEQWLTAHVLMGVGGVLLALGLPTLLHLVRGRGRVVVRVGITLAVVGAVCTSLGDFAHGSLAFVLTEHMDASESLKVQEDFFYQPALAAVAILGNLLPLGMLVLGFGLLRSGAVHPAAAILVLLSPVAVQAGFAVTALPMPVMVLPLVVGLSWVATTLLRGVPSDRSVPAP